MITVKDVYDAYPHSDLLPIEVGPRTTVADVARNDCGDTLFLFIVRELCSDTSLDLATLSARMDRAVNDLYHIIDMIDARIVAEEDEEEC